MLSAYTTLSTAAPQSAHGGTGLLYARSDIWSTARQLTASTTDRDDADAAASAVHACHDGQSSVDRWGQTDCMTRASEGRAPDRRRSGMEAGATTTHPLPAAPLVVVALMALRSCGGVASLRSSTLTPPAAARRRTGERGGQGWSGFSQGSARIPRSDMDGRIEGGRIDGVQEPQPHTKVVSKHHIT